MIYGLLFTISRYDTGYGLLSLAHHISLVGVLWLYAIYQTRINVMFLRLGMHSSLRIISRDESLLIFLASDSINSFLVGYLLLVMILCSKSWFATSWSTRSSRAREFSVKVASLQCHCAAWSFFQTYSMFLLSRRHHRKCWASLFLFSLIWSIHLISIETMGATLPDLPYLLLIRSLNNMCWGLLLVS